MNEHHPKRAYAGAPTWCVATCGMMLAVTTLACESADGPSEGSGDNNEPGSRAGVGGSDFGGGFHASGSAGATVGSGGTVTADGWLYTSGNHIYRADGSVFHGRGANLHDTRSCWRCAWNEPDPDEVTRRIDALVDDWKANFIRLTLESYGAGSEEQANGAVQYGTVLEDADYLKDIRSIVDHVGTKPGVVVLLSLWTDPSIDERGWPTGQTRETWRLLARTFSETPHVMFGLVNEPQSNFDGAQDAEVWTAMNGTVEAIREEEDRARTPHHIVTVQGTGGWARYLDYYVSHPIVAGDGENVAYEVHVYDAESDFTDRFVNPAATLPVVIGEFGPDGQYMTMDDCSALMPLAEQLEVPYLAWTFHMSCPPNLIEDTAGDCGSGAALNPTAWGELLRDRLAQAW